LKKINFLHINVSDLKWGASIEAYRLHKALLGQGFGSHLLCAIKQAKTEDSSRIIPGRYSYLANAVAGKFFNSLGLQSFGYPSSFFIKNSRLVKNFADVIILRNLHWWYFSIGLLPWLAKHKPLIWRFPDMWALTGHCAYSYDCLRWQSGCGNCPRLKDYPGLFFDTTHFLWLRKKKIYEKIVNKTILVAPSLWLKRKIEESPITKNFRCEYIPSAVDLSLFKPGLKKESRKKLNLSEEDRVIMFSAYKLKDRRKGGQDLSALLTKLNNRLKNPAVLILVGQGAEELNFPQGVKVIKTGLVRQDKDLLNYYNAADVFLSLSRADNLPNSLIEAGACGVPIVALDNGGCHETINEGETGYAVKDMDAAISALEVLLDNDKKLHEFSTKARKLAESKFSMESQASSFVTLANALIYPNG
jgi:glycosyltransferase involved in cell wall biosynthesis